MSHLLDTHALAWALQSPDRLGAAARAIIEDPANTLLISPASGWEIATKARLRKWSGAAPLLDGLPEHLRRLRATELPISLADAVLSGRLTWEHRDPFDRMLVAQALNRGLTILTKDAAIAGQGVPTLW